LSLHTAYVHMGSHRKCLLFRHPMPSIDSMLLQMNFDQAFQHSMNCDWPSPMPVTSCAVSNDSSPTPPSLTLDDKLDRLQQVAPTSRQMVTRLVIAMDRRIEQLVDEMLAKAKPEYPRTNGLDRSQKGG
jgi:hypothetical protein